MPNFVGVRQQNQQTLQMLGDHTSALEKSALNRETQL